MNVGYLVLIVAGLVLLLILPSPWNFIGLAACLLLLPGEAFYWNRTVRGRRVAAGAETLIGAEGEVLSACRPRGQVQIDGEIWEARCDQGADPGATVRVVGRDGLTLLVEPT